jgi:hypothetical protein
MKNLNKVKAFIALLLMVFFMTAQLSAQAGRASTVQPTKTMAVESTDCGFMLCTNCNCTLDFCPCATALETTEQQRKNILRYESLLRSYDSNVTTKAANDVAIIRIAIQNNDLTLFKSAFDSYQLNVAQLSVEEKTSIQTWGAATNIAVSVVKKE